MTQKLIIDGTEITDIKNIELESREEYLHSIIKFDCTVNAPTVEVYITKQDAETFEKCLEKYRTYKTFHFSIKRIIPEAYCIYGTILDFCNIRMGDDVIKAYMTSENFHKFGEIITKGEVKMDNIEQEFFRVFGIEPEYTYIGHYPLTDENGIIQPPTYPEITAEKLLQMICIAMKYKNAYRFVNGIEDLKEQTLEILISLKDMVSIYAELQQLFSE